VILEPSASVAASSDILGIMMRSIAKLVFNQSFMMSILIALALGVCGFLFDESVLQFAKR